MNDFHVIDKNQIFALHYSTIQELNSKRVAQATLTSELTLTMETQTTTIANLITRVQALEQP